METLTIDNTQIIPKICPDARVLSTSRRAVATLFLVNGTFFATWGLSHPSHRNRERHDPCAARFGASRPGLRCRGRDAYHRRTQLPIRQRSPLPRLRPRLFSLAPISSSGAWSYFIHRSPIRSRIQPRRTRRGDEFPGRLRREKLPAADHVVLPTPYSARAACSAHYWAVELPP